MMAVEPHAPKSPADVVGRLKHEILRGRTARNVTVSGITFKMIDHVGVWTDVTVIRGADTAEFGMSLYGGHNGAVVLGLMTPAGNASAVKTVSCQDPVHALKLIWQHLHDFAESLLSGTATASTETVVLHKTEDVIITATPAEAGYNYEIACLSPAGAAALNAAKRTGHHPGRSLDVVRAQALDQLALAAAEPQQAPAKPVRQIWVDMGAAFDAWARKHADEVVAEHGNVRIHIDGSGEREGDNGLIPLYTTVDGVRKVVQGDDDFPSPYMRFHLGDFGKTISFQICVDTGRMTKEKNLRVPSHGSDIDHRKFIPLVLSVIKSAIAPDLHQVRAAVEVVAASRSCLDVVVSALGDDGSKLVGKTVFGGLVTDVVMLDVPDTVSFRAVAGDVTMLVRIQADKSVTAQVYTGIRYRAFATTLKSTRLAAICTALQFHEPEPEQVTAAAEPPAGPQPLKVLQQLQHLRIRSKHFHVKFMKSTPHPDDHGNLFILGDVVGDAAAEACFGPSNYQYGFSVVVNGRQHKDGSYSTFERSPYDITMPHVYPDPEAPTTVPIKKQLTPSGSDLTAVATAVTKTLLPWLKSLDAKVDGDAAVAAALALPGDELVGEYFVARPGPKLEINTSTRSRSRRYIVELKQEILYKVFDNELKPIQGDRNRYVFFAIVNPGAANAKVLVSFITGDADHAGNITGSHRSEQRGQIVAADGVADLVRGRLRDYIADLDRVFADANS